MRPGRTVPRSVVILALLLAGMGVLLVLAEAHAQTVSRTPAAAPASTGRRIVLPASPAVGGMVVGIDPETGMLVMPEPEALAKLVREREARALAVRPAPVHHPDGSISLDVHSWMREFVMASAGPGGKPRLRCVTGKAAAEQAANAPAAPALEER